MAMSGKFRLALIQLAVTANKAENVSRACQKIKEAAEKGANIVTLPECFNSPFGNQYFPKYAEPIPGDSTSAVAKAAKDNSVYLIAGSLPEREGDNLYNTCVMFGPDGELVAKFRKAHLFDINVPGKIKFEESKTITAGDSLVCFDTPYCRVGIGICFDIRFPLMAKKYADNGCKLLVYPGAFNLVTGPRHWELLTRARAVDNQLYMACASPARDENATYVAWGHSLVVNPWGEVIGEAGETEQIVMADIDTGIVDEVRQQIPVTSGQKPQLYQQDVKIFSA